MADKTRIAWCDATWSPVTGCDPVSPGCDRCAAGWRVVARRPAHTGWWRAKRPRQDKGSAGVQHTLWEAA